jgi:hypothetical protein
MVLQNRLLIRRITTVSAIRNTKKETVAFKGTCNHGADGEKIVKVFTLMAWGAIAYELAEDWALNHKCSGDGRI